MEKLTIDCGVKQYKINGKGVLVLNPTDPNVYARFASFMDQLPQFSGELDQLDKQLKHQLALVFPGNDFDALLGGVSLLAVAGNGQTVFANLVQALMPVLEQGMAEFARQAADRAQRRRESQ